MKYNIVFLGTSEFALPSLSALLQDNRFDVKAVFTQPDKKVGRKQELQMSPIKKLALEHNLDVYQPESMKDSEWADKIQSFEPDYLVVVSYGQILPQEVLDIPKLAAVNIHSSLLPKYRGASPMQMALLNGDDVTGVTIQKMVYKLDAGDILSQQECEIDPDDTFITLQDKLSTLSAPLLVETLSRELSPIAQKEEEATFCHKIEKENGQVDWKNETANQVYNKLRAFTPWPGIFTFYNGKRLKMLEAFVLDASTDPGKVIQIDDSVGVGCKEGVLGLKKVQIEGKKPADIGEFVKGYGDFVGSVLGG